MSVEGSPLNQANLTAFLEELGPICRKHGIRLSTEGTDPLFPENATDQEIEWFLNDLRSYLTHAETT